MWGPLLFVHAKLKLNENALSRKDVSVRTLMMSALSMIIYLWAIKVFYFRHQSAQLCQASGIMLDWVNVSLWMGGLLFLLQYFINMRFGDPESFDEKESTSLKNQQPSTSFNFKAINTFMFIDAIWGFYGVIITFIAAGKECHLRVPLLFLLVFVLSTFYLIGYSIMAMQLLRIRKKTRNFIRESEFEITYNDPSIEIESGLAGNVPFFIVNGTAQKNLELEVGRLYIFLTEEIPYDKPFTILSTITGGVPDDENNLNPIEPIDSWKTLAFVPFKVRSDLCYGSTCEGGITLGGKINIIESKRILQQKS